MLRAAALVLPLVFVSCTGAAAKAPADGQSPGKARPANTPVAAAASEDPQVTGTVVEAMDAGGYTYVRLDTGAQKIWAATSPIKVKIGQELTIPLEMPMENFHSQTLGRDFPVIYFASRNFAALLV